MKGTKLSSIGSNTWASFSYRRLRRRARANIQNKWILWAKWRSDDGVVRMPMEEKNKLYKKAQDKARATLEGATSLNASSLQRKPIPIQRMRKGEERFAGIA